MDEKKEQEYTLDFRSIADLLNQGLILINKDMDIEFWNSWMEEHSRIDRKEAIGKQLDDIFPDLKLKGFFWKVDNVFTLGNFSFFSQRMHQYVFPLKSEKYIDKSFEYMQQSVSLAPIQDTQGNITQVLISVVDETDSAIYRNRLEKTMQALEDANRIDHLTQVNNRRFLMECLGEEISFHHRTGSNFTLIILDIDHFKRINDTYGHLCGDQVLIDLTSSLKKLLRPYDKIGRYGGEEFCLLLPNTNLSTGLAIAERLRVQIGNRHFSCANSENSFRITISLGLTSTETFDNPTTDQILQKADEALYLAKNAGRNKVQCVSE